MLAATLAATSFANPPMVDSVPGEILVQQKSGPVYWEVTEQKAPRYPLSALTHNWSGCVTVSFIVLSDGTVGDMEVLKSKPKSKGVFKKRSLKTVKQFKFRPTKFNPEAKPARLTKILTYTQGEDRKEKARKLRKACKR